jgi:hypothetical protein
MSPESLRHGKCAAAAPDRTDIACTLRTIAARSLALSGCTKMVASFQEQDGLAIIDLAGEVPLEPARVTDRPRNM